MLTVAGLGAFMSSTGVVAIFIPVGLSVSMRMNTSPSRGGPAKCPRFCDG